MATSRDFSLSPEVGLSCNWRLLYCSRMRLFLMSRCTLLLLPLTLLLTAAAHQPSCPAVCECSPSTLLCTGQKLNRLPPLPVDHAADIVIIDLSRNNFSHIPDGAFVDYIHLEELNLAVNNISTLTVNAVTGLHKLRILNLRNNRLKIVPRQALTQLSSLQELHLGFNELNELTAEDFKYLTQLRSLLLEGNSLISVPAAALFPLEQLEILSLADNNISQLPPLGFANTSSSLQALSLANNRIQWIHPLAFQGLDNLEMLELQHNELQEFPSAINLLPFLKKLSVAFNSIEQLSDGVLDANPWLVHVDLLGNPVSRVSNQVFTNLTQLKILIIPEAKELNVFPDLNGTSSLEFLRIDRAKLRDVPADLCQVAPNLKTLDLKSNELSLVPHLESCTQLRQLQLSGNGIQSLEGQLFRHQQLLHDLLLNANRIRTLPVDAFMGLEKLEILNLMGNQLTYIHPHAFLPLKQLIYLNLAENLFPQLPSVGLQQLRQLLTYDNPWLRDFPPPSSFPQVHTLRLSYAYHCCQFASGSASSVNELLTSSQLPHSFGSSSAGAQPADMQETVLWLPKDKVDLSLWLGNNSDLWPAYHNLTHKFGDLAEEVWGSLSPDYAYPSNLPQVVEDYFEETRGTHDTVQQTHRTGHVISCSPQPGPFMPCEDLFDWWTLRCGVWVVFLLSMLGNGAVVLVLVFSRSKMDVPRFLVCNLACSDFCMGIYLGFLAVVDASTLGHFKMHALQWQFSAACQTAGFLGVLSSELSVITLAVITLERNYAITHAMHLNKRLSLKHAAYIMTAGWMFALFAASLPLLGVSDYRKFAICLPFDIEAPWSLAYVVFLMAVNGCAFLILMGCYLKMYCAIRGSQAWNSNDSRIAKRMALLVFTDFLCWAPIAFFALTAVFGLQLISLEEAKVFTIFVLPLNSCANPFLYAILTKQFKKDCVLICKAIEESRVTRGIGRCRHSSNFSNRQTPANTNSAVDRHSNQLACSCSRASNSDGAAAGTVPTTNNAARRPPFALRFLLCGAPPREAMADTQKGARHMSISSDNFSSSRSDSWRRNNGSSGGSNGVTGKLSERGRRISWTATRKASQDSNLSSSRNDSSATTPSTSTWRVSRSSVSSDSTQRSAALVNLRERQQETTPPNTNKFTSKSIKGEEMQNAGRQKAKLKRQSAVIDDVTQLENATQRLHEQTFTPRKLSTISSTSCSLNQESWGAINLSQPPDRSCLETEKEEAPITVSLCSRGDALSMDPRRVHSDDCFNKPSQVPNMKDQLQAPALQPKQLCPKCQGRKNRMYYSDYVLNSWWHDQSISRVVPKLKEEQQNLLDEPNKTLKTTDEQTPLYLEHDV